MEAVQIAQTHAQVSQQG